jgi:hypothetical protein
MTQIVCPHCLEHVDVPAVSDDSVVCCPACMGLLGAAGQDELTLMEYEVSNPHENPHKSEGIQEYVHYLEKRARKEKKEEPYERRRFPVEFVAAMVFFAGALGLFLAAFFGALGLSMLYKLMGGVIFLMLGVLCLRFSVN